MSGGGLAGAIIRLVIILPLILLLAYVSIKYGFFNQRRFLSSGNLKILDRAALGPRAGICVVQVDERYFLLGYGDQQVSLLQELDGYPGPTEDAFAFKQPWQDLNLWLQRVRRVGKGDGGHEKD